MYTELTSTSKIRTAVSIFTYVSIYKLVMTSSRMLLLTCNQLFKTFIISDSLFVTLFTCQRSSRKQPLYSLGQRLGLPTSYTPQTPPPSGIYLWGVILCHLDLRNSNNRLLTCLKFSCEIRQVPKVNKIVVNCGIGDAAQNNKGLDAAINDMALITGQRPVKTKAKNPIATFKIRENQTLGIAVTLRGNVSFFLVPLVF